MKEEKAKYFHYLDDENGKMKFVTKKISREDLLDFIHFKKSIRDVLGTSKIDNIKDFEPVKLTLEDFSIGLEACKEDREQIYKVLDYLEDLLHIEEITSGLIKFNHAPRITSLEMIDKDNFLYMIIDSLYTDLEDNVSQEIISLYLSVVKDYIKVDGINSKANYNVLAFVYYYSFVLKPIGKDIDLREIVFNYKDRHLYFYDYVYAQGLIQLHQNTLAIKVLTKLFNKYQSPDIAASLVALLLKEEDEKSKKLRYEYLTFLYVNGKTANAAAHLCDCYLFGEGTKKNVKTALEIIQNSIDIFNKLYFEEKDKEAVANIFYRLAMFYEIGVCYGKDLKKSLTPYLVAKYFIDEAFKRNPMKLWGLDTRIALDLINVKKELDIDSYESDNDYVFDMDDDFHLDMESKYELGDFIKVDSLDLISIEPKDVEGYFIIDRYALSLPISEVKFYFNEIEREEELLDCIKNGDLIRVRLSSNEIIAINKETGEYDVFDYESVSLMLKNYDKLVKEVTIVKVKSQRSDIPEYLYITERKDLKENESQKVMINDKEEEVYITGLINSRFLDVPEAIKTKIIK